MPDLPELRHVQVGYLRETWADLTLDAASSVDPHISGPQAAAARDLYAGLCALPIYRDLTPAQRLARMVARLRGPTWAIPVTEKE